jgi:hypothetical protein
MTVMRKTRLAMRARHEMERWEAHHHVDSKTTSL